MFIRDIQAVYSQYIKGNIGLFTIHTAFCEYF